MIVRRERPHPGAQLSFTDHDGYRFQATLTDQTGRDIADLERRHRARAGVEHHIRNDKDTGLRNLPSATSNTTASGCNWSCSRMTCSPGSNGCC